MTNNIIIVPDLEGRSILTYTKNNIDKKIYLIGDLLDSTTTGIPMDSMINHSSYNLSNIHTVATNDNIVLFYGNRDLTKLTLCHSLVIKLYSIKTPIYNMTYVINFNQGNLRLTYENYKLFDEIVYWEYDSKYFNNISNKNFTKNTGDNDTFYNRLKKTIYINGVNKIFIECIFIELKLLNNIFDKCTDENDLLNYKCFIILGIFKSMFIPKIYINTDFDQILINFRNDLSQEHFQGILWKIYTNSKNKMVKYYEQYLISHGGITNRVINFINDDMFDNFKLSIDIQNKFLNFNLDKKTELFIENINLINYYKCTNNYDTIKYTVDDIKVFEQKCNKNFLILIKNILSNFDFSQIILLKCMFTELHGQINISNDSNEKNNYYSPIGPGIIEYINNWNILSFCIYKDKTYKSIVETIQIFGHKPISCANSVYYDKKKNHSLVNIDTSNTFNNTKDNNECKSSNIVIINNEYLQLISNISLNLKKNFLQQKIYKEDDILNDIILYKRDIIYLDTLLSNELLEFNINNSLNILKRYNAYTIIINNTKYIYVIHGNTNLDNVLSSLTPIKEYYKIYFILSKENILKLTILLTSHSKYLYKYFKNSYIKYKEKKLNFIIY